MGKWNTVFLGAALAFAGACSGAASAEGEARLLCAGCAPLPAAIEGENPLIGEPSPCSTNSIDVGRDFEGFGLSAAPALQLLERQASSLGVFGPMPFLEQWVGANEVRGHDDNPQVDVGVEVTRVTLQEREGPAECEGRSLKLRGRIRVTTSDGALNGSFENASFTFNGDAEAVTTASADASTFTGSLDFRRDRHPFRSLAAGLYLSLTPDSVSGFIHFAVLRAEEPLGALTLQWPADASLPLE